MPIGSLVLDRWPTAAATGHADRGKRRKGGDALCNALFDKMPEDTVMCLTLVATPQDGD